MADVVTSQTIYDGPGYAVIRITSESDGTGESAIDKVDPAALAGAPTEVVIERIEWAVSGMAVKLLWHATTNVLAYVLPSNTSNAIDFRAPTNVPGRAPGDGIHNNAGAGKTGKLKLTTIGPGATSSYSITLWLRKRTP